jgi:hypothetical protein
MEKAGDILGKKYGPLPFGAWLVIIAVTAYGVRRVLVTRASATDTAATDEGYVVDSNGNMLPSAYKGAGGGLPFGSGVNTSSQSDIAPVTGPTEIDNSSWVRRAAEKLQTANMWDAISVQSALIKYTTGENLNDRESAIVNQAIKMEGQPPVNVYGGSKASSGVSGVAERLVRPAGNSGVFVQYSNGVLRWLPNSNEITALQKSDPDKFGKIVLLPVSDPLFQNSDVYQQKDTLGKEYLFHEAASRAAHDPAATNPYTIIGPS